MTSCGTVGGGVGWGQRRRRNSGGGCANEGEKRRETWLVGQGGGGGSSSELARALAVSLTWRARPAVLISAPDMSRVWGVPVSPGGWTGFARSSWVTVFCPGSDRTGRPNVWGGYEGFSCRCSYATNLVMLEPMCIINCVLWTTNACIWIIPDN